MKAVAPLIGGVCAMQPVNEMLEVSGQVRQVIGRLLLVREVSTQETDGATGGRHVGHARARLRASARVASIEHDDQDDDEDNQKQHCRQHGSLDHAAETRMGGGEGGRIFVVTIRQKYFIIKTKKADAV